MNQEKINQLTNLLKRLNSGEDPLKVKKEAQGFLASVEPSELSMAEQKLLDAGLKPEDLRHLCSAHLEMLGDEVDQMKANLKPGHMIHTLISEHEFILNFLDELEKTNQAIQKMKISKEEMEEVKKLKHIAEHLVGAEPHHQREEEILFPAVESRGVYGPPQVMRMEHEDLRRYKKELKELVGNNNRDDFDKFKKELDRISQFIVLTLRDHIFKENSILYPTALQVIPESEVWQGMKQEADKIGYCCFTPEV